MKEYLLFILMSAFLVLCNSNRLEAQKLKLTPSGMEMPQHVPMGGTFSGEDAKVIQEYRECCGGCNIPADMDYVRASLKQCKKKKQEETTKNMIIAFGVILLILIIVIGVNNMNSKTDPIKNLESLRENKIISPDEFEKKVSQVKEITKQESLKKENEKLIQELENLRKKGVLSDAEYEDKVRKIEERKA